MAATLKWGGDTKGLVSSLRSASQSVTAFQAAAVGAASALTAAMGQGVALAADLDQQMRRVQNLTGFDAATRKQLTESIEEISKARGIEAVELARAAEAAHTQGVAVADLGKEIDLAAGITNAFGGSTEDVGRQLVKMGNVWDLTTKQVAVFGQMGARVGDTDLTKLSTQLANVSTQTSRVNLDFKETALILGFATRQMKNTDRAGTSLVQVFAELAKEDSRVSEAIQKRYGQTFAQMVEDAENVFEVLQRMLDDFGQESLTQLFGSVEAQAVLPAIFNQLPELKLEANVSYDEAEKALDEAIKNSDDSAKRVIDSLKETYNDFVRDLVNIDPGSPLYTAITSLTEMLDDPGIRGAFQNLAKAMLTATGPMKVLAKALTALDEIEVGGINGMDALTALLGYQFLSGRAGLGRAGAAGAGAIAGRLGGAVGGAGAGRAAATGAARIGGMAVPVAREALAADFAYQILTGNDSIIFKEIPEVIGNTFADLFPDDFAGSLEQAWKDNIPSVVPGSPGGLGLGGDGRNMTEEELERTARDDRPVRIFDITTGQHVYVSWNEYKRNRRKNIVSQYNKFEFDRFADIYESQQAQPVGGTGFAFDDAVAQLNINANKRIDDEAVRLAQTIQTKMGDVETMGEAMLLQDMRADLKELFYEDYTSGAPISKAEERLAEIADKIGEGNEIAEEIAENTEPLPDRNFLVYTSLSQNNRTVSP